MACGVSFSKKLRWHGEPGPGLGRLGVLGVLSPVLLKASGRNILFSLGLPFPVSSCCQVVSPVERKLGHGPWDRGEGSQEKG